MGELFRLDQGHRISNVAIQVAAIVVVAPFIFVSDLFLHELTTLPFSWRSLADKLLENLRMPAPVALGRCRTRHQQEVRGSRSRRLALRMLWHHGRCKGSVARLVCANAETPQAFFEIAVKCREVAVFS